MNTNESTPKIMVIKMSHVQKAKEEVLLQFTIALNTASIQCGMEVIIGKEVVCSSGISIFKKLVSRRKHEPG